MMTSARLPRTLRLFRAFRNEQRDPSSFYRLLADDTVQQISRYCHLNGSKVLDVGGASGYFGDAIRDAGGRTLTVEYEWEQIVEHGRRLSYGVQADGQSLPVRGAAFDVAYSSNVLEHVEDPERMLAEMIRVVCPGGIVYVSFTNWLSPWGGHETAPWHYLGGEWAARRYERLHGRPAKNRYGVSLFPLHIGRVLAWVRGCPDVEMLDAFPRYYPQWMRPLVRLAGIREVATWNLAIVMRRRLMASEQFDGLMGAGLQRTTASSATLARLLASKASAR
jgi:SAM-dependent methyltransferase